MTSNDLKTRRIYRQRRVRKLRHAAASAKGVMRRTICPLMWRLYLATIAFVVGVWILSRVMPRSISPSQNVAISCIFSFGVVVLLSRVMKRELVLAYRLFLGIGMAYFILLGAAVTVGSLAGLLDPDFFGRPVTLTVLRCTQVSKLYRCRVVDEHGMLGWLERSHWLPSGSAIPGTYYEEYPVSKTGFFVDGIHDAMPRWQLAITCLLSLLIVTILGALARSLFMSKDRAGSLWNLAAAQRVLRQLQRGAFYVGVVVAAPALIVCLVLIFLQLSSSREVTFAGMEAGDALTVFGLGLTAVAWGLRSEAAKVPRWVPVVIWRASIFGLVTLVFIGLWRILERFGQRIIVPRYRSEWNAIIDDLHGLLVTFSPGLLLALIGLFVSTLTFSMDARDATYSSAAPALSDEAKDVFREFGAADAHLGRAVEGSRRQDLLRSLAAMGLVEEAGKKGYRLTKTGRRAFKELERVG